MKREHFVKVVEETLERMGSKGIRRQFAGDGQSLVQGVVKERGVGSAGAFGVTQCGAHQKALLAQQNICRMGRIPARVDGTERGFHCFLTGLEPAAAQRAGLRIGCTI